MRERHVRVRNLLAKSLPPVHDGLSELYLRSEKVTRFVLVAFLSLCVVATSLGAPKSQRFKRGEKVEVELGLEVYEGEVVGMSTGGWIRVKFTNNVGFEQTMTLPSNYIHRIAKSAKESPEKTTAGKKAAAGNPLHTWSDKSGRFSIKARLVEITDGKVRLEQEDGTIVAIPLNGLSDADRKFAKDSAKTASDNPFKPEGDNPFKPEGAATPGQEQPNDAAGVASGDWSSVRPIIASDVGPWTLAPDTAGTSSKRLEPKAISLHAAKTANRRRVHGQTRIQALVLVPDRNEALVFASDVFGSAFSKETNYLVHRVDLAKGKAAEPFPFQCGGDVLDVDPSGRRVAIASQQHGMPSVPQLQIWEFGKTKPTLIGAWNPVEEGKEGGFASGPRIARFVDANHLLAVDQMFELVLWEIPTKRAIYTMKLTQTGAFALSPGRKFLAASVGTGTAVFEPLTGKTLGRLQSELSASAILAFEPGGRRLAAMVPGHIMVYDFEKGAEYRDFYFPKPAYPSNLDWVGDGYLLSNGSSLVDLERRVVLWEYRLPMRGHLSDRTYGELGGVFWYTVGDGRQHGIVGVELPHAEAKAKAASFNAADLLALKPGASVKLSVRLQNGQAEQDKVTRILTAQLKRIGIEIEASAPLVLAATMQARKNRAEKLPRVRRTLCRAKRDDGQCDRTHCPLGPPGRVERAVGGSRRQQLAAVRAARAKPVAAGSDRSAGRSNAEFLQSRANSAVCRPARRRRRVWCELADRCGDPRCSDCQLERCGAGKRVGARGAWPRRGTAEPTGERRAGGL